MGLLDAPRINPPAPVPDPAARERFLADQAERARVREERRPERVAAIGIGPVLVDPEAAVDCLCSCHPRPADPSLHDGGVSCPCQPVGAEERARRAEALAAVLNDPVSEGIEKAFDAERDEFARRAAELGVDADLVVFACPTTISGVVDGHRFYVRERHDDYRVVVDPAGDTVEDLHAWTPGALLVAAGSVDELDASTPTALLELAVAAVRTHLRRQRCGHGRNPGGAVFCCDCGVALDTLTD